MASTTSVLKSPTSGTKKNENVSKSKNSLQLNLLDELVFYGSYHHNPINQLIHLVFVPMIIFSLFVLLRYIPSGSSSVDYAFVVCAIYVVFYCLLDPSVTGVSAGMLMYGIYTLVSPFVDFCGKTVAWKVALGLQVLSWYMQIHLGHIVMEKRKPALLDSFHQSVLSAPLFVYYEALFFMGFHKELKKRVDIEVEKKIAQWNKTR